MQFTEEFMSDKEKLENTEQNKTSASAEASRQSVNIEAQDKRDFLEKLFGMDEDKIPAGQTQDFTPIKDAFTAYENGKGRRYSLLFAVNGGAFALAKLLADDKTVKSLKGINIYCLAIGMIIFTFVMWYDIFKFGTNMQNYVSTVFRSAGKKVLAWICLLIIAGWFLVALFAAI
jgi:hypothetical protein